MIQTGVLSYLVRRLTELGWSDLSILEVSCGDAHLVSGMERFFTFERLRGI